MFLLIQLQGIDFHSNLYTTTCCGLCSGHHQVVNLRLNEKDCYSRGPSFTPNEYNSIFLAQNPAWVRASSFTRFLDHIRHITVGRTPLDERSARRRDLYLTIHNTRNRHPSMPPVGFEPTNSFASGRRPTP